MKVIKQGKNNDIEIAMQPEAVFETEEEKRELHKNFNWSDESQRISHSHINLPTIYSSPRSSNLVAIHILSAVPTKPDPKYLIDGCQKHFIPTSGECMKYRPLRVFSAYITNSGGISSIMDIVELI